MISDYRDEILNGAYLQGLNIPLSRLFFTKKNYNNFYKQ